LIKANCGRFYRISTIDPSKDKGKSLKDFFSPLIETFLDSSASDSGKRKSETEEKSSPTKRAKNEAHKKREPSPRKVVDGIVRVYSGVNLTVVSLQQALSHQKYDQFEVYRGGILISVGCFNL